VARRYDLAIATFRPRLIATDLDGTLLRPDATLSERTARALARAIDAGIPVVPVTARPLRWLGEYAFLRDSRYVIFANGAVVYDAAAAAVATRHHLAVELLGELIAEVRTAVPGAVFAVETDDGWRMRHDTGYPLRSDAGKPGVAPVRDPVELLAAPAVKLLVKQPSWAADELLAAVGVAVGARAEVTMSAPYGLVEVATGGVTKATGLAEVAAALGVAPRHVVAFGDMPNDVSMLAWAGYGVAVANAHAQVHAVADEVTASNAEDGVAAWIEALLG
jgi:Cof subfamily protein (haloacid dehalogenase superfamily)